MRLKDKVAIISGGAHGMGECEARLFAREGAAVVIADVITEGQAVAADISAGQGRARFIRCDVTSETDWQRVIAETMREFGRLDILVNNAGISGSAVGDHDDLAGWKKLLDINATGVFLGTKLAAVEMMRAGGGSIVNISSIMGVCRQRRGTSGVFRIERSGAALHQSGGLPVWTAWRARELGASGLSAADVERDQPGHARLED
jgi:NAD(P)-dependent dehydrogenase (short-subunit alcohol dehydrogenase family)